MMLKSELRLALMSLSIILARSVKVPIGSAFIHVPLFFEDLRIVVHMLPGML